MLLDGAERHRYCCVMIPPFKADGNLPPGIHEATWEEIVERFGGTERREQLLDGLYRALIALKAAGCRIAYVNGSFTSTGIDPGDFDGCWETDGIDYRRLDPVLYDFEFGRRAQKRKYGGEFFPTPFQASPSGERMLDFYQRDKETHQPKGIIRVDLGALR